MCYAMPDSSKNDPEKRNSSNRVSVYIDWFNVYHWIKKFFWKKYYWLSYKQLSEKYKLPWEKFSAIKFFTAYSLSDKWAKERHVKYVEALNKSWVTVILWKYQQVHRNFKMKAPYTALEIARHTRFDNWLINTFIGKQSRKLRKFLLHFITPVYIRYTTQEEKKTDVNIAINLLEDAYQDKFDTAILISWDNDISPAVESVKKAFPNKKVKVILPIGTRSRSLSLLCDEVIEMKEEDIANSLFPDVVYWIQKPEWWQ